MHVSFVKKVCLKLTKSTKEQFQLETSRFEAVMKKKLERMVKILNQVLKGDFNVAAPFIGMAVEAKTKNLQSSQVTTNLS